MKAGCRLYSAKGSSKDFLKRKDILLFIEGTFGNIAISG
jgi:hypothetical protein